MVDIINHSQLAWPAAWPKVCRRLVTRARAVLGLKKIEVAITMVEPAVIKKLNRRYRRIARVTDVLSFTYELTGRQLNGEIVICLAQAEKQARRRRHSLERELNTLVTHGLVHLAGFDHQVSRQRRQMQLLEKKVLF